MKQKNKKQNQKSSGYGCEEEAEREKQRRLLLQNAAFREVRRKSGVEYSSSSSSDSSNGTGAGFSSSDDSFSIPVPRSQVLKPIRTSTTSSSEARPRQEKSDVGGGGGFVKKKSRSLKNIYGDLKKVKQPISPGGRLASFLNSLFTAGTAKKAKIGGDRDEIRPSNSTSACSSASSFSRSCLSKTPSSRGGGGGGKRSVRFYPVSVIVDEDSRPCGHKSVYGERREDAMAISTTRVVSAGINNPAAAAAGSEELKYRVMSESRRVEEVARELLKSYKQMKSAAAVEEELFSWRRRGDEVEMEVDEEDDDVASCASSDLFELDNLSSIEGIERYREELPVYETTHFKTNRAIANGLVY
ncbi:unnamed protein product [Linum tenue]|uniref:Protein BIG GRAIN 1-like A n=1 Tax=Linum tenue TaxID=586396 RepID=A0AAV0KF80_9ROSI|nr:unnamed protein product [Linum tenue]